MKQSNMEQNDMERNEMILIMGLGNAGCEALGHMIDCGVEGVHCIAAADSRGFVNLDFSDIRGNLSNVGRAAFGVGTCGGRDRATLAARTALKGPLMPASPEDIRRILVNFTSGPDVTLVEMCAASEAIKGAVHPKAAVLWGHVIDETMGECVRVTVLAARAHALSIEHNPKED